MSRSAAAWWVPDVEAEQPRDELALVPLDTHERRESASTPLVVVDDSDTMCLAVAPERQDAADVVDRSKRRAGRRRRLRALVLPVVAGLVAVVAAVAGWDEGDVHAGRPVALGARAPAVELGAAGVRVGRLERRRHIEHVHARARARARQVAARRRRAIRHARARARARARTAPPPRPATPRAVPPAPRSRGPAPPAPTSHRSTGVPPASDPATRELGIGPGA